MARRFKFGAWADVAGIWLSALCLVHCFATPFLIVLLPTVAVLSNDLVHKTLAIFLPFVALMAFIPGYRRHRHLGVPALGLMGVFLIGYAAFSSRVIGHRELDIGITMAGSSCLIAAHWLNRRRALRLSAFRANSGELESMSDIAETQVF